MHEAELTRPASQIVARQRRGRSLAQTCGRGAATIAVIATGLVLAACSSDSNSDFAQVFEIEKQAWAGSDPNVTFKQAAAVPYASIGVRVGDGTQQMLVLVAGTGGGEIWTSRSHIVLRTLDGRIVRTAGLDGNLGGLATMRSRPPEPPVAGLNGPRHEKLVADFPDLNIYSAPIACTARPAGPETITILQHAIRTVRIEERCEAASLGWSYVNTYWIDPASGLVWRSRQHVHPGTDPIEVEVFRPLAG